MFLFTFLYIFILGLLTVDDEIKSLQSALLTPVCMADEAGTASVQSHDGDVKKKKKCTKLN